MQQRIQKKLNELIEVSSSLYRHVHLTNLPAIQNRVVNLKIVINEQANILDDWLAAAEIRLKTKSQAFFAPLNTKIDNWCNEFLELKTTVNDLNANVSVYPNSSYKEQNWIDEINDLKKTENKYKAPQQTEFCRQNVPPLPKKIHFSFRAHPDDNVGILKTCSSTFFQAASAIYNPVVQNLQQIVGFKNL